MVVLPGLFPLVLFHGEALVAPRPASRFRPRGARRGSRHGGGGRSLGSRGGRVGVRVWSRRQRRRRRRRRRDRKGVRVEVVVVREGRTWVGRVGHLGEDLGYLLVIARRHRVARARTGGRKRRAGEGTAHVHVTPIEPRMHSLRRSLRVRTPAPAHTCYSMLHTPLCPARVSLNAPSPYACHIECEPRSGRSSASSAPFSGRRRHRHLNCPLHGQPPPPAAHVSCHSAEAPHVRAGFPDVAGKKSFLLGQVVLPGQKSSSNEQPRLGRIALSIALHGNSAHPQAALRTMSRRVQTDILNRYLRSPNPVVISPVPRHGHRSLR